MVPEEFVDHLGMRTKWEFHFGEDLSVLKECILRGMEVSMIEKAFITYGSGETEDDSRFNTTEGIKRLWSGGGDGDFSGYGFGIRAVWWWENNRGTSPGTTPWDCVPRTPFY